MADLKLAMGIMEKDVTETIDNILFDMKEARDEHNLEEVRRVFAKTVERIGHATKVLDAHRELGHVAI